MYGYDRGLSLATTEGFARPQLYRRDQLQDFGEISRGTPTKNVDVENNASDNGRHIPVIESTVSEDHN